MPLFPEPIDEVLVYVSKTLILAGLEMSIETMPGVDTVKLLTYATFFIVSIASAVLAPNKFVASLRLPNSLKLEGVEISIAVLD